MKKSASYFLFFPARTLAADHKGSWLRASFFQHALEQVPDLLSRIFLLGHRWRGGDCRGVQLSEWLHNGGMIVRRSQFSSNGAGPTFLPRLFVCDERGRRWGYGGGYFLFKNCVYRSLSRRLDKLDIIEIVKIINSEIGYRGVKKKKKKMYSTWVFFLWGVHLLGWQGPAASKKSFLRAPLRARPPSGRDR